MVGKEGALGGGGELQQRHGWFVYHLWFNVCFPSGIPELQSDLSLFCDHGLGYANNNIMNGTPITYTHA